MKKWQDGDRIIKDGERTEDESGREMIEKTEYKAKKEVRKREGDKGRAD